VKGSWFRPLERLARYGQLPGVSAHTHEPGDASVAHVLLATLVDPDSHTLTTENLRRTAKRKHLDDLDE
jgi:hypothetical protein